MTILFIGTLSIVKSILFLATLSIVKSEEPTTSLYEFSLHPPFLESGINNKYWNFGGDAFIEVDNYVRLTADVKSQSGWLWSRKEFQLEKDAKSWMIEVEFTVGATPGLSGDGFAFWYTTDKEKEGPVFGNKNKFVGLGVFFDTYQNTRNSKSWPYISAMIGDGVKEYNHDTDGHETELSGCSAKFRLTDEKSRFKIKYVKDTSLTVWTDLDASNSWTECFSVPNIKLPEKGYFGFSARTGGLSDIHDIKNVALYTLDGSSSSSSKATSGFTSSNQQKQQQHHQEIPENNRKSGGSSFLMNLLIFCIIVFVAYAVWVYYQKSRERNYKRF